MTSRRAARVAAVEVLYAADIRGVEPSEVLAERGDAPGYTTLLVTGVAGRRDEIDDVIVRHAVAWPLDRMSGVDRNVLRVGAFELLEAEVPPVVAIDEAVHIAKRFSGEEAGGFVNGVLDAVRQELCGGPVPGSRGEPGGTEGGSAGSGAPS